VEIGGQRIDRQYGGPDAHLEPADQSTEQMRGYFKMILANAADRITDPDFAEINGPCSSSLLRPPAVRPARPHQTTLRALLPCGTAGLALPLIASKITER
jgi:hypothetical protein